MDVQDLLAKPLVQATPAGSALDESYGATGG
jgi:hypothetical protein